MQDELEQLQKRGRISRLLAHGVEERPCPLVAIPGGSSGPFLIELNAFPSVVDSCPKFPTRLGPEYDNQHAPTVTQYWLTFNQAKQLGGNVRKGEHGTKIVFWKFDTYESETADGETEERKSAFLRYYTVFNLEQTEGLKSTPGTPASVPDSIGGRDRQTDA